MGLARASESAGARIFENSRVVGVEKNGGWKVKTRNATLEARHVIQATNLPIWGPIPFDERTRPRCHIAMAFEADKASIEGMFIGLDDPHSLRMGRDAKGPLLVVLGPKFDTGQEGDVAKHFLALEAWSRRNFSLGAVAWRWANEDYDAPERLPFVGELKRAPGLYVATGFSAWGISNGGAAGILIAKQILGEQPGWAKLYDPERKAPSDFNKGGETQSLVHTLDSIPLGEGRIIPLGRGKIAVHRANSGELNALSASCTHKGCTVTWNNAEETWDCPCHGSIFAADGSVLHGPAVGPLLKKTLPEQWVRKLECPSSD